MPSRKAKVEAFLQEETTSNEMWAAQQILTNCSSSQIRAIGRTIKDLETVLFKSWAKDLTLGELIEVMKTVIDVRDPRSEEQRELDDLRKMRVA